jgi:hypothetical protein
MIEKFLLNMGQNIVQVEIKTKLPSNQRGFKFDQIFLNLVFFFTRWSPPNFLSIANLGKSDSIGLLPFFLEKKTKRWKTKERKT